MTEMRRVGGLTKQTTDTDVGADGRGTVISSKVRSSERYAARPEGAELRTLGEWRGSAQRDQPILGRTFSTSP